MRELIEKLNTSGEAKVALMKRGISKYFTSAMMAGIFVGFGIILIFTIGGVLQHAPSTKIIMGVSFGIALSLVLMAGGELFTGCNFILTVSTLEKRTTWSTTLQLWGLSFVGNFVGSILIAAIYVGTGLPQGSVADFINSVSSAKMNAPYFELFMRGILCNTLVCLAIWCSIKLKDETAKLIMIFWCLFAFITSGYEHSVANMTLLSISLLIPHPDTVSLAGMVHNLIPVSLGNILGGAVIVGVGFWYIAKEKSAGQA
ncbi:formate/nitrite transporter family protein [Paenibacillus xanthanilyticus]|uniref:Formate/nitrite transporter family protein n=1 Tax=Paenibacillus xanthanilyticus TaxID=1783531 RepID=A0ABV8K3V7_9BACL